MNAKLPRASRPYRLLITAISALVEDDIYLDMTEDQMVGLIMKGTGGAVAPIEARAVCKRLLDESGVR